MTVSYEVAVSPFKLLYHLSITLTGVVIRNLILKLQNALLTSTLYIDRSLDRGLLGERELNPIINLKYKCVRDENVIIQKKNTKILVVH